MSLTSVMSSVFGGGDLRLGKPVKYTRRADDTGWLAVLISDSKTLGFLCEYTKIELLREAVGRVYFKVVDGNSAYVGKEASLKAENAKLYLSDTGPDGPAIVQVQYQGAPSEETSRFKGKLKQQWALIDFSGNHAQVTLNSIWDQSYTPIPAGTHMVMAPDQSHANIPTIGYRQATAGLRCTDVWFPIQVAGVPGPSGRYVHVGHLSEGCVTVHELTKWNALYDYLISHRMPNADGKYIGTLVVRS